MTPVSMGPAPVRPPFVHQAFAGARSPASVPVSPFTLDPLLPSDRSGHGYAANADERLSRALLQVR